MRRWAAGTDEIPAGVWRDILFRLEARRDYATYYMGEIKKLLGQVEVYSFSIWNHANGVSIEGAGKSTPERVARIGGTIVAGTGEWVTASDVDAEGRLRQSVAFQTQTDQPRPR